MRPKGTMVTCAGLLLNLALGVLYAWSIFSKQLTEAVDRGGYGWSQTAATLPYTVAIACFALVMIPAGRLQDRLGPRPVATLGAILCGIGLMIASLGSPGSTAPVVIGFGLLSGTGIGLGYASATPAALKWFGPHRKGLITGIVVGGFGLAPVYIAPLSKHLLSSFGVSRAFLMLGIAFLVVAGVAAQFLVNPPRTQSAPGNQSAGQPAAGGGDATWRAMLRAPFFYALYVQYACAATAGLMIIGHMAKIVSLQSGGAIKSGFVFVALLAIFNASGRVVGGVGSDLIGRVGAMIIVFVLQALAMFFFGQLGSVGGFLAGAGVVGFSYGACLSLFPATTADCWGTKGLGLNYGILFTAWGVGGVFGPILASKIVDATGSYLTAYYVAGGLLMLATLLAMASHITLSFRLPEKQLVITFGRKSPNASDEKKAA